MGTLKRRAALAALLVVAGSAGLTGCIYNSRETEKAVPSPTTVVVAQPAQRVYTYPEGKYELYGNGTAASPYYWVWIPAGARSVPPPPVPPLP